ncbi:MAG: type II toxin-antitoxin system RelE/ParE family toxin [Chloroflexi bacterium]|nr:type II toxin-antitoxin system RelE/ParE family toxin [Chloroflexota bacterium]
MKVAFKSSFAKDLRKIKDNHLKSRIKAIVEQVEQAESLPELANLKQMKGASGYFRIRVGDYTLAYSSSAYSILSTSAFQLASMMLALAPTVLQLRFPCTESIKTRVVAAVAFSPSKIRTL